MARTLPEITTQLDTTKAAYPALAGLTSPSATSVKGVTGLLQRQFQAVLGKAK